ncbi:MAG: hypothetical protein K2X48_05400 [Chitinophagaceae bacterium]|nr:hypothetical protein [Chitinophagaceae bacterium]
MIQQIFKVIPGGVLAGFALFIMPFILIKLVIFFLLIGLLFRLFGGRRRWHHRHAFYGINPQKKHEYAQRWRNMNEDERKSFLQKMESELFKSKEENG